MAESECGERKLLDNLGVVTWVAQALTEDSVERNKGCAGPAAILNPEMTQMRLKGGDNKVPCPKYRA